MNPKIKITIGVAVLVLLIAGAALAYDTLRGSITPEIMLADQPGSFSDSQAGSSMSNENAPSESEKLKAPDFTAEDAEGGDAKLSDWVGKPVVLNFWASWCPPCKAEMPDFDSVYAELGDEVAFMMVNLVDGQRETKETGSAYVSEQGFSFPVYYDITQEAAYAYGIRSIPTTLFIDSNGYIVTGAEGQLDEKTLRYGISLIQPENSEADELEYRKISAEEAYAMMNEMDSIVLLDVRTDAEYQETHIPGAILMPDTEIAARAEAELPEKDVLILVYCRSGQRSASAANALVGMGYTRVYDFGGIIDWPYEVE